MARRGRGYGRHARRSCGLNLLFAVDKPAGQVTRALDNAVQDALHDDGVGHIGTLDPAVTGVVVLCVGQARKLISLIEEGKRKSYKATIAFGTQTDTDDAEGAPIRIAPVPDSVRDAAYARDVLARFAGVLDQVPPKYSAIKVDGVRAYDRARAGEEFELPARSVEVHDARLVDIWQDDEGVVCWECDFDVSAGTYVRALARDIGRAVGSAAHLGRLCRTASGNVSLADCVTLEQVMAAGCEGIGEFALDPTKVLGLPVRRLTAAELEDVQNGRFLSAQDAIDESCVSIVRESRLYGVWQARDGRLRPRVNCPLGIEGVRS